MVDHRPQSPRSNELQYGLHHLANHTAASPLQQEWRHEEVISTPQYSSPGLMQHSSDPFVSQTYSDSHYSDLASPAMGLGIHHADSKSLDSGYVPAGGHDFPSPPYIRPSAHDGSMTPMSQTSDGVRHTRSGRSTTRSRSPHTLKGEGNRVSKASRSKKSRSNKAFNSKMPKLEAPLSELTKDMAQPVRDMEEWVNRPAEVRQQEVVKRNGYVTRPMNSFMLYRSAYAERTKQWCLQNNHQVVSSVSGESWPLEPEDVREHYNHLARVERDNHARAHPSYKFSPSKTPAAKKKRSSDFSEDDDDEDLSDLGDPDKEWMPRNDRRGNGRLRRPAQDLDLSQHDTFRHQNVDPYQYQFDTGMGMNMPSWEIPDQVRSMPAAMLPEDIYSQFYQSMTHPGMGQPSFVEDQSQISDMHGMYAGLGVQPAFFSPELNGPVKGEEQVDPSLLPMYEEFDHGREANGAGLPGQLMIPSEGSNVFGADAAGTFRDSWVNEQQ